MTLLYRSCCVTRAVFTVCSVTTMLVQWQMSWWERYCNQVYCQGRLTCFWISSVTLAALFLKKCSRKWRYKSKHIMKHLLQNILSLKTSAYFLMWESEWAYNFYTWTPEGCTTPGCLKDILRIVHFQPLLEARHVDGAALQLLPTIHEGDGFDTLWWEVTRLWQ